MPGGWTHEQDNTKTVRRADGATVNTLVREFGLNDYRKSTGFDFGPAYRYWDKTASYWSKVRARWDIHLVAGTGLHLKTKVDGMAMIIPLCEQAAEREAGEAVTDIEIDAVFAQWVELIADAEVSTFAH